ncbi:hypothetical protein BH10CYA1_BH10CYA1_32110 [soil metagenome]
MSTFRQKFVAYLLDRLSDAAQGLVRIRLGLITLIAALVMSAFAYRAAQAAGTDLDLAIAIAGFCISLFGVMVRMLQMKRARLYCSTLGLALCLAGVAVLVARSSQVDLFNAGLMTWQEGRGDPVAAGKLFEKSFAAYQEQESHSKLWRLLFQGGDVVTQSRAYFKSGKTQVAQKKTDKAVEQYLLSLEYVASNSAEGLADQKNPLATIQALEKLWLKGAGGGGRGSQPGAMQKPSLKPQVGGPQTHDSL